MKPHTRSSWQTIKTTWLALAVLTAAIGLGFPVLIVPESRANHVVIAVLMIIAIADFVIGERSRRMVFARLRPGMTFDDIVRTIGGMWLRITVRTMTATIAGMIAYVSTGNRPVLWGLCAVALLGLVRVRPSVEQFRDYLTPTPPDA